MNTDNPANLVLKYTLDELEHHAFQRLVVSFLWNTFKQFHIMTKLMLFGHVSLSTSLHRAPLYPVFSNFRWC